MKLLPKMLELQDQIASGIVLDKVQSRSYFWEDTVNIRMNPNGIEPMKSPVTVASSTLASGQWLVGGNLFTAFIGAPNQMRGLAGNYKPTSTRITATYIHAFPPQGFVNLYTPTACYWDKGGNSIQPIAVNWGDWYIMGYPTNMNLGGVLQINTGVMVCKSPPTSGGVFTAIPNAGYPLTLVQHGAYILGFNYSQDTTDSTQFKWCSADDAETWVPSATNSAGDLHIREFISPIRCAVVLGDNVAVYSDNGMAIVRFIGAPLYYGYTMAFHSGIGAYSPRSVIAVNGYNYGWGKNGFFKTDGVQIDYIGKRDIQRSIEDTLDISPNLTYAIFAVHYSLKGEIWWWYCTTNTGNVEKPDKVIIYNYNFNTWTTSNQDRTTAFMNYDNSGFLGYQDTVGFTWMERTYNSATPLSGHAMSKALDFGSDMDYKLLQALVVDEVTYTGGAYTVEVGVQDQAEGSSTYTVLEQSSSGTYFALLGAQFFRIRFTTDGSSTGKWEVQGLKVHGKVLGGAV